MSAKIVILWARAEMTGQMTEEDPRVPGLRNETVKQLRDLGVDVRIAEDDNEVVANISDADVYYSRVISPEALAKAEQLKWFQTGVAGMDGFWFPELRQSNVTITNGRGIYSDVISDHLFGMILCFARGLHVFARLRKWEKTPTSFIHLGHTTLGIVGLGGIGLAVAARGHTSDMRVIGVDPAPKGKPDYIEQVYPPEELHKMLAESDFVAMCVPHTSETEHLIDAAALDAMKDTAIILNVGRGKVIALDALTTALQNGSIGGAGLDVYEQEPLPDDHPLWQMDNVILTPHVAGRSAYPYQEARRLELLVENMKHYLAGEDLANVVDKEKGYVV